MEGTGSKRWARGLAGAATSSALALTATMASGVLALDETFPPEVAGIRFGQPISRVERSCADEGGTWSGDACELGSGADRMLVTAEACRGRKVCRVSMIDTDRFPAEDVAGWVGRFQSRRRTLVERHGEPSVHRSRTDCARAVLDSDDAACIVNESGNSVSIAWSVGGGRVVLRLYKNERRRSLQIEERYESPTAVAEDAEVEAPVRH
ncbi:MAG: hypothetical protein U0230_12220 [Polyangiales bacterium]